MAVPYTFGSATSAIPLSQLDSNFATAITLGNTAIQLGNTVTTLNNMTLANVTVSSGNVTVTTLTAPTINSGSSTALSLQSNGTTAITIDTSQNVGIGASPYNYGAGLTGLWLQGSSNPVFDLAVGSTRTGTFYASSTAVTFGSVAAVPLLLFTANTERARIDSSGNVGIGTSSPLSGSKLTANGAILATSFLTADQTSAGGFDYYPSGNSLRFVSYGTSGVGGNITFQTGLGGGPGASEHMRIDSSGNLLVGTTSQIGAAKLSVYSGNTNATTYTTAASTGGSSLYVQQQQTTSVSTSAVVILTPSLYGSLCLIQGSDGTNRFQDLVMFGLGTGTVNVISALAIGGSPASRTYSQSGSAYRVAMGSGTYTVQVAALSMNS